MVLGCASVESRDLQRSLSPFYLVELHQLTVQQLSLQCCVASLSGCPQTPFLHTAIRAGVVANADLLQATAQLAVGLVSHRQLARLAAKDEDEVAVKRNSKSAAPRWCCRRVKTPI